MTGPCSFGCCAKIVHSKGKYPLYRGSILVRLARERPPPRPESLAFGPCEGESAFPHYAPVSPLPEDSPRPMPPKMTFSPTHPAYAASAKATAKRESAARAPAKRKLGSLPEWNLADLYSGAEAPELKTDLTTAERAADAMQERYAGRLATLLDGGKGGYALAQSVREFEQLNDLLGRIVSYAESALCGRHFRPQAAEILRRHPGEDHRHLIKASILSTRVQSSRRQGA